MLLNKGQLKDTWKCHSRKNGTIQLCDTRSNFYDNGDTKGCLSDNENLIETALHYMSKVEQLEAELASMGQIMADAIRVDDENEELRKKAERQAKVLEQAKDAMKYINVVFLNTGAFQREYIILKKALTAIDEVMK